MITTIEQMEKIVAKNKELNWDGWTVVMSYPSDKGRTSKFGALINNKWHMTKRFEPSRSGWNIPEKYLA